MNDWGKITMGELLDNKEASLQTGPFGTQFKASEYVESGTPVINVKNIGYGNLRKSSLDFIEEKTVEKLHAHVLKENDIVFGRKGAADRHAIIGAECEGWVQGSDCMRLRLFTDRVSSRFLSYYFLTSGHKDWMEALCSFGATMSTLNQGIVRRISLDLPPIETQRKIAGILSAYDELIETNARRIARLEQLAEEIYREWFVRFRFPGYQNAEFVKGVPVGWEEKLLPEVADITYGFAFKGSRFNTEGNGRPIIRIRNILESSITDFTDEVVNDKYIVRNGDFLVGMDGQFHMNHWHGQDSYLVQRVCKIQAKNSLLESYIAHAVRGPVKHFEATIMGATVGHLGAMHLNGITILIPPKPIQERLHVLNDLLHQKLALANVNAKLRATRDLLLPRLLAGKLDVAALEVRFPAGFGE